jgi:DNA-binding response OmpR family regulator
VILDIDLPLMDGLSLARHIRECDKETSIVMMTAYTDTSQLLQAAELKLLTYLVKPVDIATFEKMLQSLALELMENFSRYICLGEGYGWDVRKEKMLHRGTEVSLTAKEREMIALLVARRLQPVSFEEIMARVWADEFDREVSTNCIKNIISDLRKKLPKNIIKSVYGKGYMLQ